jgi:aminomethyltransferase
MVAVQGPRALGIVERVTGAPLAAMKYYTAATIDLDGAPAIVSRTGYTGEDGFELIVPQASALRVWEQLLSEPDGRLIPSGLGCRDTLRLEAAMPLYGHELDQATDPLTAGLDFAVKFSKPEFIGRPALLQRRHAGLPRRRVGLQLSGRRIAREGATVHARNETIGRVTSGTFSPTLERAIAMAYVDAPFATIGQSLEIGIRGQREPAEVVPLPFYKRAKA